MNCSHARRNWRALTDGDVPTSTAIPGSDDIGFQRQGYADASASQSALWHPAIHPPECAPNGLIVTVAKRNADDLSFLRAQAQ
jgi:hypothetical protein